MESRGILANANNYTRADTQWMEDLCANTDQSAASWGHYKEFFYPSNVYYTHSGSPTLIFYSSNV